MWGCKDLFLLGRVNIAVCPPPRLGLLHQIMLNRGDAEGKAGIRYQTASESNVLKVRPLIDLWPADSTSESKLLCRA